jgi:cytochrome P450
METSMAAGRRTSERMFDTSLTMAADGPRGIAVVNNFRFLIGAHHYAMATLAPWHDQPIVPVTGGNASVVVALGEDSVRQVVTDNDTFHRAGDGVFTLPEGHGYSRMFEAVITANGGEHRRRRKLLMPVVQKDAMEHYRQIFTDTYARSRFARPDDDTPFDAVAELLAVSKTNMLRGMLGIDDTPANRALADDILALAGAINRPEVSLFKVDRPWTPYGRWVARVASAYERLAALIDERRRGGGSGRLDALSIICDSTDENGDRLDTVEIAGELHGFFAAGFETTAITMSWALLTILAGRHDLDPTDDKDLDALVKESQRLLPTVPMSLPRRVTADVSVAGSSPVPAGALLFLSAVIEHHDARTYPDPYAYRPRRWLGPDTPRPTSFFPFGIGARRCLGAAFAELQTRVTLAAIAAEPRPLRLLTDTVDYRIKSGVTGAPRKPIIVTYAPGGPAPDIRGTVTAMWHPHDR